MKLGAGAEAGRWDQVVRSPALRIPRPLLAGEVGERSETGEGLAGCTTLTRVATLRDLSREERERYTSSGQRENGLAWSGHHFRFDPVPDRFFQMHAVEARNLLDAGG